MTNKTKKLFITTIMIFILLTTFSVGIWLTTLPEQQNEVIGLILTTISSSLISQSIAFIPKYLHFKVVSKQKKEIKETYEEFKTEKEKNSMYVAPDERKFIK